MKNIPEHLLETYFTGRKIKKPIRNIVIFGTHNLIVHPPISHLDILLCRNVLMYFTSKFQAEVLQKLHSALERGGFLILSRSESLPVSMAALFRQVNKLPIYHKL